MSPSASREPSFDALLEQKWVVPGADLIFLVNLQTIAEF